ncbi:DUF6783 domain-containing protein [Robinsoniella sp.]
MRDKSPTKCDAQLPESKFKTRSSIPTITPITEAAMHNIRISL